MLPLGARDRITEDDTAPACTAACTDSLVYLRVHASRQIGRRGSATIACKATT